MKQNKLGLSSGYESPNSFANKK